MAGIPTGGRTVWEQAMKAEAPPRRALSASINLLHPPELVLPRKEITSEQAGE
jgi:hypothetical protein